MSEYFANDPECHDLLPSALRSHRVAGLGDVPQGRLWVESRPRRLRPCAVLWPCTFCSDRALPTLVHQEVINWLTALIYLTVTLYTLAQVMLINSLALGV